MFYSLETNQIKKTIVGLNEGLKIAICSTKHGVLQRVEVRHVWHQKGWEFGFACSGKLSSVLNEMFRHVLLSGD